LKSNRGFESVGCRRIGKHKSIRDIATGSGADLLSFLKARPFWNALADSSMEDYCLSIRAALNDGSSIGLALKINIASGESSNV
jgi:hypothetical protein